MAEIILQDIRIGTDVHMLVTLTDSGVAISWDSVDIQQLFAYSEPQRAFAGNCTYVIDEEDATKLHVTYPAAVQKLLGRMRLVAQVNLLGNVATYDAFAFNIVKFSDDDEDPTVEEIEVPLAVEAVDTTIMYEILRACQAATAAANEAKEGADEAADAATAAAAAANSAAAAANSAAEAATAAKEAADLATAAANAAADSANSAAADATAGAAAANSAAAAATAAKEAAERATTAANSAAAAATSAANSANAAASAATTATTNANAATAAANSAATAANSAAAAATAAKEAADLATAAATAAAAAANAAAARVETAIENAAAATTAANSAAAAANSAAATASSAAAAATAAKEAADLATTAANTAAATANTAAEAANSAAAAAAAAAAQIPALVANKANIDGWYSAMTVGAAENLVGRGTTPAVISFRPAGGPQDIGTGAASIAKIKGRTDAWNQLTQHYSPSDFIAAAAGFGITATYDSANKIFTLNGTATRTGRIQWLVVNSSAAMPPIPGHKYYGNSFVSIGAGSSTPGDSTFFIRDYSGPVPYYDYGNGTIFVPASGASNWYIGLGITSGAVLVNVKIRVIISDLTLQYGAGREPATVAAFLSEYPEALFAPYNAGKLINNKVTAVVTDGFNQWNERWFNGAINEQGQAYSSASNIAAYNFMPCLPSINYAYDSHKIVALFWYDANRNFIYRSSNADTGIKVVTSPANAAYFRFYARSSYGTTYKNDIAINLSHSGIRNGEYEPYWKSTLNIDHAKIYGKLEGAGEMVQIAPNGFRGVGANYDEVDVVRKEAYIRRAWVDLGTLTWTYESGSELMFAPLSNISDPGNPRRVPLACAKYTGIYDGRTFENTTDKSIFNRTAPNLGVMVKDSAYSDAAAFKTAMDGVMLDYQLATPLHYTDLMYSEDGGQTFVEIPVGYRVDDYGTERRLPDGLVDGAPASTPLVAEIQYAMNAVDPLRNLPRNYLSKQSTENLLAAMQSAGIIAGYTMTYDEDNAEYDFTITAPAGA